MTDPISADTDLLNSAPFQEFRRLIAATIGQYDAAGAEYFPFGTDLTKTDLAIIAPIVNAHPHGSIMLHALLDASGGDAEKVNLLAKIIEAAEEENADMANFNTGPGIRP